MEVRDKLMDAGVPCNLITGEERVIIAGAQHTASTIEMMNPTKLVDVAIIDEIQMLQDPDRGSAWTAALVGVCALMPLVPVAVVERLTPMAAFRRAAALTQHNRNRILGLALVLLVTLAPSAALVAGFAGPKAPWAIALFEMLAWSLGATVPAAVYAGLRGTE